MSGSGESSQYLDRIIRWVTIQGTIGNNYNIQSTTNLANPNSWATVTNITLCGGNH
jgi:hypothetical protein